MEAMTPREPTLIMYIQLPPTIQINWRPMKCALGCVPEIGKGDLGTRTDVNSEKLCTAGLYFSAI